MEKVNILVVCTQPELLKILLRLINGNTDWQAFGAASEEQAHEVFAGQPCQLVLLGSGTDTLTENRLKPAFSKINPQVKFIQHYGGGSGLLYTEIYEALRSTSN